MNGGIEIVEYVPAHRDDLVEMWRTSFEEAVGIADPNPIEDQRRYFDEEVVSENRVLVVLDSTTHKVIAFMVSTAETISQLYVHVGYQRQYRYNVTQSGQTGV